MILSVTLAPGMHREGTGKMCPKEGSFCQSNPKDKCDISITGVKK